MESLFLVLELVVVRYITTFFGFFWDRISNAVILGKSIFYKANISCNTLRVLICAPLLILPSFFISLNLSMVRIWSNTTWQFLFLKIHVILVGYGLPFVVIGAMITVEIKWFISSGDMITHGLVFLILCPTVGSRLIRKTSNLFISSPILRHPILHLLNPVIYRQHFQTLP